MGGLVDTNVFIHAQTHDRFSEECLRFLEGLSSGRVQGQIDSLVIHELSYALPGYRQEMTRAQIAEYLLAILAWEGLSGEKGMLAQAVERWRVTPRLAFVDAYLATRAASEAVPVFSKNVSELRGQGVEVPDPLPNGLAGSA